MDKPRRLLNSKLFENGEVAIRWYSKGKILTVKDEKAADINEK